MKISILYRHLTAILLLVFLLSSCQSDQKKIDLSNSSMPQGVGHGKILLEEEGLKLTYFSSGIEKGINGVVIGSENVYGQLILENLKKGVSQFALCLTPYDSKNSRTQVELSFFKNNQKIKEYKSPVLEGHQFESHSNCNGFLYSIDDINLVGNVGIKIKNIANRKIVLKSIIYNKGRNISLSNWNYKKKKYSSLIGQNNFIKNVKEGENEKDTTIKGVVTAHFNNIYNYYIYVQDETSGIAVDTRNLQINSQNLIGKTVMIKGHMENFYGLPLFKPNIKEEDHFTELDNNLDKLISPKEVSLNDLGHNIKGDLIRIDKLTVMLPSNKYGYITAQDEVGRRVLIKELRGVKFGVGMFFESITGVLSYSYGEYKVYPRKTSDILINRTQINQNLSYLWSAPFFYGLKQGDQIELKGTSNAKILYTLDGNDPVKYGKIYQNKILFNSPKMTIRAVSCVANNCFQEKTFEYYQQKTDKMLKIQDLQKVIKSNQFLPHYSIYNDTLVRNIQGYITHIVEGKGFFIQNGENQNCFVSDGIFIKTKNTKEFNVGNKVKVEGLVTEINFEENKKNKGHYLTQTALFPLDISIMSFGPIPFKPIIIGHDGCQYPDKQFNSDNFSNFNPTIDGLDYYKSLQSRLVKIKRPVVVGPSDKYKGFYVRENIESDKVLTGNNGVLLTPFYQNSDIFYVKTKKSHNYNVGDIFEGDIQGIMTYDYGTYGIKVTEQLPDIIAYNYNEPLTRLTKNSNSLMIASYNIENFCRKKNRKRINKIARNIVVSLKSPDVVGLQEIMDNDCTKKSEIVSGSKNFKALIDAIIKEGGPNYSYEEIEPINGKEGGIPGGNIRVGFLYNKDIIQLTDKVKGGSVDDVNISDDGLSLNPARVDALNPAFENSRKSLVIEFKYNNHKVYIINNHFKSKLGDYSIFERRWPLFEFTSESRRKQFKVITQFAGKIIQKVDDSSVVILGDMNDFHFSQSLKLDETSRFFNASYMIPDSLKYSYNYRGNSQMLDHIILSKNLFDIFDIDVVHLNSNINFYDKISDHDPVIIKLNLD